MLKLESFLLVSVFLFAAGMACIVIRRNIIQVLMGIELILNAAALNFVAFSHFVPMKYPELAASGQVVGVFIIVLAAAEACVALALVFAISKVFGSVDIRAVRNLRG